MSNDTLRSQLRYAEERLALTRWDLCRQQEIVASLERMRRDASNARKLLVSLQETHRVHLELRNGLASHLMDEVSSNTPFNTRSYRNEVIAARLRVEANAARNAPA